MVAVTAAVVVAILGAGTYCWMLALVKLAQGQALVSWSERRAAPWGMVDLAMVIAVSLLAAVILDRLGWLPAGSDWKAFTLAERRLQTGGLIAVSLVTVVIGLPLIALRTGATLRDFGWSREFAISDMRLGFIGFAMLAPPVYAIQAILVSVWKPSEHPLVEGFRETRDLPLFVLSAIAAVIVAPVVEELLFRVLLQGLLEKAFSHRGELSELFFGRTGGRHVEAGPAEIPLLATSGPELAVVEDLETPSFRSDDAAEHAEQAELRGGVAWLPIGISAVIFSLLHWQHGPDWVPLLVLAAGMGYLYQRTHRLLPSLVVHVSLNAVSMWGLWVQVHAEGFRS